MSIFAEAAKKVARTCASQSSHSKNCEPTPTTTATTTTVATAEEVVSEVVEKFTFMGYVKHFIASIEVWHLNVFSTVVVILFVYIQFRSMFIARPRPKQIQHESFNQKEAKQKEFADKQVGDSIDVVDDHDDEFHAVKEIPYRGPSYSEEDMWKRSQLFYESMKLRRSVRCFSNKTIPIKIIQNIIKTAGTGPSGANLQPWTFCVVSNDSLKARIREIVEAEEQINYSRRQVSFIKYKNNKFFFLQNGSEMGFGCNTFACKLE
jgi:hypothetical protein